MSDQSDLMADQVRHHAERIMRASGSSLANYTLPMNRNAILSAVMDCYEEAYRSGAAFAAAKARAELGDKA